MEVLHLALDKATEEGLIEGFNNVIHGMKFSHLQFADDIILFLKAEVKRVFEIFSGRNINFNKSCLVGFEVEEELLYTMATICKCKIGALPFNYLGIPLGANPKRLSTWEPIIDRVRKKLSGLKCRSLLWAGRVVLINAVMSSLLIYFMSLFQASVAVIKKIYKIRRNFL
ncbi:putative Transposon TX1 [Gossypium australe]|uniref:Putative Transposon TX1 n=1 Tax=Gossypium australe TaxID=47621 RepID=A0A5B6WJR0_9ROSI|nr:putative Transposon TX1 [Gossypium australe]